ncbi:MAG: hypothetical protein U0350_39655 [Caldilineaceae bacterium]
MHGVGLEPVNVDGMPLLAVTAPKQASLPLPLAAGTIKPMGLRVIVPTDAVIGDTYILQVVQIGPQREMMGGVTLGDWT